MAVLPLYICLFIFLSVVIYVLPVLREARPGGPALERGGGVWNLESPRSASISPIISPICGIRTFARGKGGRDAQKLHGPPSSPDALPPLSPTPNGRVKTGKERSTHLTRGAGRRFHHARAKVAAGKAKGGSTRRS